MMLSGRRHEAPADTIRSDWNDLMDMLRGTARALPDRGIFMTDERGGQEFRTYGQLLEAALRVGAGLEAKGLVAGDRVVLALPSGFDFIEAFFGTVAIGAVPVPIAPPFDASDASRTDQAEFFVRFSKRVGAACVMFRPGVGTVVRPPEHGVLKHVLDLPQVLEGITHGASPARKSLPELAYIQITSGETSTRGAVLLSHRSILENLESVGTALEVTSEDFAVSWLPLFSTMGLIGGLFSSIYWGLDMALIAPERFLKKPDEWLLAMSRHGGTLSASPSFAFHYAVRRSQKSLVNNIDLSAWRVAMIGGEVVRRFHLESFSRRFEECGFDSRAFVPVYGLAESTLGVSFGALGAPIHVDFVSRPELELRDKLVEVEHRGSNLTKRAEFVSVGAPIGNVDVQVIAGDVVADERQLGEIHFRGPNVMMGYDPSEAPNSRAGIRADGWVPTGDSGYVADGELFVVGRISARFQGPGGRRVFAEDIELVAQTVDGVRYGAVVAFAISDGIALAYEAQEGADEDELQTSLDRRLRTHFDLELKLIKLSPRSIPRSPSGKIRRHLCMIFYENGVLERRNRQNEFDAVRRFLLRSQHELRKFARNVTSKYRDKS